MIADGLLDEINSISYPSKTVLQAIGLNLSEDIEENINIKTNIIYIFIYVIKSSSITNSVSI